MKLVQVFNWEDMPTDICDQYTDIHCNDYGFLNGAYIRWYPNGDYCDEIVESFAKKLNEWLLSQGMENSDPNNDFHYVLIYVSW